jgi:hypothetical protein
LLVIGYSRILQVLVFECLIPVIYGSLDFCISPIGCRSIAFVVQGARGTDKLGMLLMKPKALMKLKRVMWEINRIG